MRRHHVNGLTDEQVTTLSETLRERHQTLRVQIRDELEQTHVQLAGRLGDIGDLSVADLTYDLELDRIDAQVKEIRAVERALQDIIDGTYGRCQDCEDSIGYRRLLAFPTASRCIACQERFERDYHTPGHTSP
jgi:RNA polymerase-binding protein DksA